MKHKKQILAIAIPASVGFFFQTMFNVVDTYFAGQIGTTAVAALSLSFPMFLLILSVARGLGSASNVLIANAIGEGNNNARQGYFRTLIILTFLASIFVTILGPRFVSWVFTLMGAEGQYLAYANDYMRVILYGFLFMLLPQVLNGVLNSHEDTKSFRNIAIISFLLNCILDPILIFGWGPIPALQVTGLAWATIVLQAMSCVYLWYKTRALGYSLGLQSCKDVWHNTKEILYHGIPAAFNMVTVSLGIFIITYFITVFGEEAIAAYGIATRIEQIALLPTIGLNIAAMSLIGKYTGAKKYQDIPRVYFMCLKFGLYMIIPITFIVYIFADQFIALFDNNQEVIQIGGSYLRIVVWLFWAYIILFVSSSTFQGMKRPLPPLAIGILRQIVIPVSTWYILIHILNKDIASIWWSLFVIIWISAGVSYVWIRKYMKSMI